MPIYLAQLLVQRALLVTRVLIQLLSQYPVILVNILLEIRPRVPCVSLDFNALTPPWAIMLHARSEKLLLLEPLTAMAALLVPILTQVPLDSVYLVPVALTLVLTVLLIAPCAMRVTTVLKVQPLLLYAQ
jgi:hypothetical protein